MQYGIRSEQAIEKVGEFFSVVASERHVAVGRAGSQAVPSKRITISSPGPTLSSSVIQYSDGKQSVPNECVLITCASLYVFCNEFQVKMYDIITSFSGQPGLRPDHQILRAGGPMVHCFKMLISSPDIPYECKQRSLGDQLKFGSQYFWDLFNYVS